MYDRFDLLAIVKFIIPSGRLDFMSSCLTNWCWSVYLRASRTSAFTFLLWMK